MDASQIVDWWRDSLLLTLRISPVFAFAPPFTLSRVPAYVRFMLSLGLAGVLAGSGQAAGGTWNPTDVAFIPAAFGEIYVGLVLVAALQLAFAALYVAGRIIDVQAGFGLALLIDPTSQGQTPLVGTILAYGAGLVFFGLDGHLELLGILAASLEIAPVGRVSTMESLAPLGAFTGAVFAVAFGVAGGTILALFLTDLMIAAMSRTLPQMNVLVLGFQVKVVVLLVALPVSLGAAGYLLARLVRTTLDAIPRLL